MASAFPPAHPPAAKRFFDAHLDQRRRFQGLDDRKYVLESVGNKLNLVDLVQTKSEKSLCNRWMRVGAVTPVNAKGLYVECEFINGTRTDCLSTFWR